MFQDVYIVAGAVVGDIFDAELEKRLIRARKKRILDELEEASVFGTSKLIDSFRASKYL